MIKLSIKQIKEMKHALGDEITNNPYRNYYNTNIECDSWNELVSLGLAVKWNRGNQLGGFYYGVTEEGIKLLKEI